MKISNFLIAKQNVCLQFEIKNYSKYLKISFIIEFYNNNYSVTGSESKVSGAMNNLCLHITSEKI